MFRILAVVLLVFLALPIESRSATSTPLAFCSTKPKRELSFLRMVAEESTEEGQKKKKKKKKKPAFTINTNLLASVSNDGNVVVEQRSQGRLGISSKLKKPKDKYPASSSKQMTQQEKQRTGNGTVDSTKQTLIANKEDELVQVLEAKRGNKAVTLVRGMTSPMEDRKVLLKEMKSKLGGGGSMIDGVLELQGSHAAQVLKMLQDKGYNKAKKI
jgi:translation initiation factor 1 (eIF-1/SUI1)